MKLALALIMLFLLPACRTDKPPLIEVCILDGFGGGDCVESDGKQLYKSPSAMRGYWATSETDQANYTSWCYQTSLPSAHAGLRNIKEEIYADPNAQLRLSTSAK